MAGSTQRWNLFADSETVGRGMAGGLAMLFTLAMTGITGDALGEVGVRFNVAGGFGMTLAAEFVGGGLLGQEKE